MVYILSELVIIIYAVAGVLLSGYLDYKKKNLSEEEYNETSNFIHSIFISAYLLDYVEDIFLKENKDYAKEHTVDLKKQTKNGSVISYYLLNQANLTANIDESELPSMGHYNLGKQVNSIEYDTDENKLKVTFKNIMYSNVNMIDSLDNLTNKEIDFLLGTIVYVKDMNCYMICLKDDIEGEDSIQWIKISDLSSSIKDTELLHYIQL